ncbi:multidrug ABC transporter ATP-binding protein [Litorihabitans aurantiacus]|uniref:Multidrug ABC transporter ATP-binding protein n=1 Tax=Litorihabitans aurantiacus TaxID=1930061 RepID=A0AA37UR78_9MICO|nr:multidrug ABC transporter ATP-binding protein [Litorihabitans aurantiacus]
MSERRSDAAVVAEGRRTRQGGPGGTLGMPAEKPLDLRGTIGRLLADMREHRLALAVSVVLGIASVVLAVLGPRLLGDATNLVFGGVLARDLPAGVGRQETLDRLAQAGDPRADLLATVPFTPGQGLDTAALARLLAVVAAVYVGSSVLSWLQSRIIAVAVQATMFRLRQRVSDKLGRVPLSYLDSTSRGDVLSRVTNDVDNLAQSLSQTLAQLVTSVVTVVGVLTMMFVISPVLAAVALVAVPLSALVTAMIARRSQPQFIRQWRTTGELNGHVEEMYTGHSLIKVYGRADQARRTFDERNDELFASSFRAQFISGTMQPAMGIVANLTYVLIAVLGGIRVVSGTMSLGDVQAFIQYSRQYTQPITQIAAMMNMLQSGAASAERVYALLDAPEQASDPSPATSPGQVRGRVAFEGVDFSYDDAHPLITGLDLVAEPGQTVAIVGPTGAGKTTLVNLLMRFYEIDGGRITLDGVDTREMTRDDLRRSIGMVLQDAWLFEGTIEQNICYPLQTEPGGEVTPELRERMLRAARATHVDAIVRSLPQGYETVLADEGTSLSQGSGSSSPSLAPSSPTRRSSSSTRRRARSTPGPRCSCSRR